MEKISVECVGDVFSRRPLLDVWAERVTRESGVERRAVPLRLVSRVCVARALAV